MLALGFDPEMTLRIQLMWCFNQIDPARFRPASLEVPRRVARPFDDSRRDGNPAWWSAWGPVQGAHPLRRA